MSLLDVHVHIKHNYIAYSSIAVQSSNSVKKFHRLFTFGDQDEGPQGPGTKGIKSGTVPAIRGPLRPMPHTAPLIWGAHDNVGLLNPAQLLGRKRDVYPSPTRGQHKWRMLIPAQQAQPHKGAAQMGR